MCVYVWKMLPWLQILECFSLATSVLPVLVQFVYTKFFALFSYLEYKPDCQGCEWRWENTESSLLYLQQILRQSWFILMHAILPLLSSFYAGIVKEIGCLFCCVFVFMSFNLFSYSNILFSNSNNLYLIVSFLLHKRLD